MSALAGGQCAGGSLKANAELKKNAKDNGEDLIGGFPLSSLNAPADKRVALELHRRAKWFYRVQTAVMFAITGTVLGALAGTGVIHKGVVGGAPFIVGMVFVAITLLLTVQMHAAVAKFEKPANQLFSDDNWKKAGYNCSKNESGMENGELKNARVVGGQESVNVNVNVNKNKNSKVVPVALATCSAMGR